MRAATSSPGHLTIWGRVQSPQTHLGTRRECNHNRDQKTREGHNYNRNLETLEERLRTLRTRGEYNYNRLEEHQALKEKLRRVETRGEYNYNRLRYAQEEYNYNRSQPWRREQVKHVSRGEYN